MSPLSRRIFCAALAAAPLATAASASQRRVLPGGHRRAGRNLFVSGERIANMLAIPVYFGDAGPFPIEVSSVGSGFALRAELAERFGLRPGPADPAALPAPVTADVPLAKTRVTVFDPSWRLPQPLAGVAGLDVFGTLSLIFDFPRARLGLGPATLGEPDGETIFSYASVGRLMVPVTVGGITFPAVLNTGQIRAPLLLTPDLAQRLAASASVPAGEASAAGRIVQLREIRLRGQPHVGRVPLSVESALFPPPAAECDLGALALQDIIVDLDQANRRVRLARAR